MDFSSLHYQAPAVLRLQVSPDGSGSSIANQSKPDRISAVASVPVVAEVEGEAQAGWVANALTAVRSWVEACVEESLGMSSSVSDLWAMTQTLLVGAQVRAKRGHGGWRAASL